MRTIAATIEKAPDGGYGIYTDIEGLIGSGLTEKEAKADFCEVLEEQAAYYFERKGEYPDWYRDGYEIEYYYDISGFFLSFPFINASEFAAYVGVNPSLMRKYKSGLVKASAKQKDLIQAKFNEMIRNLERVKF